MSRARLAARALLTVGVLAACLYLVDPRALLAALRAAQPLPVAGAVCCFLMACCISSAAWMALLRPLGCTVSFFNAFRLNLIGFFVNNFVPAGVGGDIWRTWVYARQAERGDGGTAAGSARAGLGMAAASVLAERWAAFLSVVLLAWLVLPLTGRQLDVPLDLGGGRTVRASTLFLVMIAGLSVAGCLVMLFLEPVARRLRGWFMRHYASLSQVDAFFETLLSYRRVPGRFALVTLFSMLSPLVESIGCWLLGTSLGLDIGPLPFVMLTPVMRIAHHFPLTMNGAGVQDAALIWIMPALGVTATQGLAFSLLIHSLKIGVSLLGLPLYGLMVYGDRRNSSQAV